MTCCAIVRMLLIAAFTYPFFQTEDNIRFGYLVGLVMMLLSIIILMLYYEKIINAEKIS